MLDKMRLLISCMLCWVGFSSIRSAQLRTKSASFHSGFQNKRFNIWNGVTRCGRGLNSCQLLIIVLSSENNTHWTLGNGSIVLKNRQDGMRTGKTNDIVFIISGVNGMIVKVG